MKNQIFTIVLIILFTGVYAQENKDKEQPKAFDKIVLDLSAIPFSISSNDYDPQLTTYSLALGYQINDKLDFRINVDQFNFYRNTEMTLLDTDNLKRLIGLSIGSNLIVFQGKQETFLENISFGLNGKFGAGISPEHSEQESLFWDLSLRMNVGKVPYFGIGVNHQISGSMTNYNQLSSYITIGVNF